MRRAVIRAAHAQARRTSVGRALSQAARLDAPLRYLRDRARDRPPAPPRTYALRGGGAVVLRHGTTDVEMFDEIHCARVYAPPPPVADALAALGRPVRVVDLGANVGLFAVAALRTLPVASLVAVEPDAENRAVLERCAAANAGGADWTIVPAAAATAPGTMRFAGGRGSESHELVPGEGGAVTEVEAIDAYAHLRDADLVKIDIEGGEWAILGDPRLRGTAITALVLEHHGRLCPQMPPRATAQRLLEAAGFRTLPGGDEVLGVGTLWAWREGARA